MEHIGKKGLPITRVHYLCKKCRRVFYGPKSAEEHLLSKCRNELNKKPVDVTTKKPSKRLVENKSIRLTFGNKLPKCQSLQSDGAKQEGSDSYVCPFCKESFPTDQELKTHLEIHARRFLCKACSKTFTTDWRMKQHSLTYCKNRLVICRRCFRIFFGPDALRKHCAAHFRDVHYICGLCGENHEKNFCNKTAKSRNVYALPSTVNSRSHGISQKETDHQQQLIYAKLDKSKELVAFTMPQFFLTNGSPSTSQEVALLVKVPLVVTTNSCASSEGASHLSENANNPGAFLDDLSSIVQPLSSSSATANQWNACEGPSSDPSVSSNTALPTLYLEGASSEIFPSSFETTYPRISPEGEALERDSPQKAGAGLGNLLGCETLETPSTMIEIDNAVGSCERQLLVTPSTEVDTSNILEGSVLKTPSLNENENHESLLEEALMGKNPSSCQIANSCIIQERAQYDELIQITIVADDPVTTVETSLKEYTSLNESTSSGSLLNQEAESKILLISETDDPSHSSEDAVPQKYLNLEIPASMFHLGIRLEGCNLHNIFMGLDMDEISSPAQDGNTHKVVNEVDNVSLRSDQEGMSMVDSELTNEKYETEMCNGKESHLHEKSDNLDISDESPEDYYLDSLETLKFLYE